MYHICLYVVEFRHDVSPSAKNGSFKELPNAVCTGGADQLRPSSHDVRCVLSGKVGLLSFRHIDGVDQCVEQINIRSKGICPGIIESQSYIAVVFL